jgi:hypothetical protein
LLNGIIPRVVLWNIVVPLVSICKMFVSNFIDEVTEAQGFY